MISVLILTLNEEVNLSLCLRSLSWSEDVTVLDSGSTDRTVEIASAAGARVVVRPFDNWAAHQNWAVRNLRFKHPWVYYSDADEVVTPELREEILGLVPRAGPRMAAYRVRYRNFFMGRRLKHCGVYPVWLVRLFRPERIHWERLVNPVAHVDGDQGRLEHHFEHHSFQKGLDSWFEKHNRYASAEAEESVRFLRRGLWPMPVWGLDAADRRRALKELSFRLPCRPLLRFLYMYVLRLGLLDGIPGYQYCRLMAVYEYMIVLKIKEIRRRERGLAM